MVLKSGKLLKNGEYRIERVLGKGGFGITYLAYQIGLDRKVAIKEFFMSDFCNRDADSSHVSVFSEVNIEKVNKCKEKFMKEARNITLLDNPHIIRIHDVFEDNNTAYYVMEFIDGWSLEEVVSLSKNLSEKVAIEYIRQVADALSEVHANKLLHLDIKPANIMVSTSGRVVLIDFGVSKHFNVNNSLDLPSTTLLGYTPGYAPLEQMDQDAAGLTPAADIYALGATLYKLLSGVTPLTATKRASGQGLKSLPPSVSPSVCNAVEVAMRLNKKNRPQNIKEFLDILNSNCGKKHRYWLYVVIAIVVVAGCIGAFFYNYDKSDYGNTPIEENRNRSEEGSLGSSSLEEKSDEQSQNEVKDIPFKTKKYSYKVNTACNEEATFEMEYPIQGDPILVHNIREWIIEEIAMKYDGDLSDAESIVEFCKNEDMNDEYGSSSTKIEVLYENSKIITFKESSSYHFEGAAGASWAIRGATFRKSDGKRFSCKNLHIVASELQPIIKEKLKLYFEVQTDEELRNCLFLDNINNIPLPEQNEPWITADGIVFQYDKYEIAAGAYDVNFIISFDEMKKYVSSSTANSFF